MHTYTYTYTRPCACMHIHIHVQPPSLSGAAAAAAASQSRPPAATGRRCCRLRPGAVALAAVAATTAIAVAATTAVAVVATAAVTTAVYKYNSCCYDGQVHTTIDTSNLLLWLLPISSICVAILVHVSRCEHVCNGRHWYSALFFSQPRYGTDLGE